MMWSLARWLYRAFAAIVILMALSSIVLSQLLPLAERKPDLISRWLSERAGLAVTFDRLATGWTRRGPLLQFEGLRIGEGVDAVRIQQAEILIAHYSGWLPGRAFSELRLRGLHLTLERLDDGRWQVRGLPGQASDDRDPLSALGRLGELQVIHARLGISAPALGIDAAIPDVDVRVRVQGARARIALQARMQPEAAPLRAALDFNRRSGNARAHAAIANTDLALWSPLLRLDGIMLARGEGQLEAWASLQDNRLSALSTRADLEHLRVQRIASEDAADEVAFGQVKAQMVWQYQEGQWQFNAPQLRIGDAAQPQVLDGLMLAGGRQWALSAGRIDAGPLLALAALSPRLPASLRDWLQHARPDASAHAIALSGHADGGLRGRLRVDNLRFASVGQTPGVSGLGGHITLDMHGAVLELDPAAQVQFDWPGGFGVPHHLKLDGRLAAWWSGGDGGIRLMTPALRVDADGYAADVRGGMWFHSDGRRPRIDMAAALDATEIPVAKRFWVRSQMAQEAIDWLDMALVSGELRAGRALVSGELADWPFDERDGEHVRGMFEAQGELAAAKVRFQPDWPVLERFSGPIRFFNDGFSLNGQARIGSITLNDVRASLPHYSGSNLSIASRASGDLHDWLALLRHSPLQASHGDILDHLDASGAASTRFAMHMALGTGAEPRIEGEAELDGAAVSETRWEVAFSDLSGTLRYDGHGFSAAALSATHAGHIGTLALRAGAGHVREAGHAFEAGMQMELEAAALLARVPALDWLRPYVSGVSPWTLALAVDADAATPASVITLTSNLRGTAFSLPAPLDKPAASVLPARIQARLPAAEHEGEGEGEAEVEVRLGERMRLHARSRETQTGIGIALGATETPPSAPERGLVIRGDTPQLDASGWLALGALIADANTPDTPAPILDFKVGQLHLPGAEFADVAITTDNDADTGSTVLHMDAPALAASLHWPKTADAPLRADFARLYWPPLAADNGADSRDPAPSAPAPGSASDPRQLPPLELNVADLRLGGVALGEALLRTQPTAHGLEIEQFRIRGGQQTITARGAWNGRGDSAQTRLELDVDSKNIGQLWQGLGLGQQVRGGSGQLRLHGQWPGSPMAFSSAHLSGGMEIALRDGQLLEVEPGAGRILGLLSVAQLPRRLLLDFRDFFGKGFGFNDISGDIEVADGIARTQGIRINGAAAKIRISGSSNLVTQTHQQTIEVAPRTGNLLTAVGAVAGGPLGAAVGAAASAVLKSPLSEVGAKTYHVTGSWQEPKVEVVTHEVVEEDAGDTTDDTNPDT